MKSTANNSLQYSAPTSRGFNLLELIIVLVVASILLIMAIPAYRDQIRNSRLSAASSDLLTSMMSAKAESVGRADFITLCISNAAATGCLTTGGWEQGWLTFVDVDADGTVDAGMDEIIQIHRPLNEGTTARGTALISNRITYFPNGLTSLTSTQTLMICDEREFVSNSRGVIVSILGKGSILSGSDTAQTDCLT